MDQHDLEETAPLGYGTALRLAFSAKFTCLQATYICVLLTSRGCEPLVVIVLDLVMKTEPLNLGSSVRRRSLDDLPWPNH